MTADGAAATIQSRELLTSIFTLLLPFCDMVHVATVYGISDCVVMW
jgi:hypothetical protein